MKVWEIIAPIDYINESIPNGSTFVYGPRSINKPHPCVDKRDKTCPGHKAGFRNQILNPHDPVDYDPRRPSFSNGAEQAKNMIDHGLSAISVNIQHKGKFISPNMNGFKIPDPPTKRPTMPNPPPVAQNIQTPRA
jgi:hypothetical protein